MKITIAGAGVGGLASAIALASRGHEVCVGEAAPAITEVGAGLQISPNGMAVLRAFGLDEMLQARSIRAEAVRLIDGPSGRLVAELNLGRDAHDLHWAFVHRADLIDILLTGAKDAGARIETGCRIEPPLDGAALEGDDLLVGADGLRSAMRKVILAQSEPSFTGQVAWRAVVPDAETAPIAEIHMGPGRHLVSYPLLGGRRNIVAVEERDAWADEDWSQEDDPANVRAAFAGFNPRAKGWLNAVTQVNLWGLFRHPVATRWYSSGQVLLGDAAHPTLPFLAQGANLALEDAAVLGQCVELENGLQTYQDLRQLRARRVVDAATANARNYHIAAPVNRFVAHSALRMISRFAPSRLLSRFDWLYRYDATDVLTGEDQNT